MILVEINGKTRRFNNVIDWLNADEQELIASNIGVNINNPFFDIDDSAVAMEDDFISIELPDLESIEEIDVEIDIEDF